jgi:hypothetical protein
MHQSRPFFIRIIIFVQILFISGCFLQHGLFQDRAAKAEKEALKQEAEMQQEFQKDYQHRMEAHIDQQSDETLRLMKKMQKKSRKSMEWRRRSWFRENF